MESLKYGLLESDLQQILIDHERDFKEFSNFEVLIIGGTGFLGSWLLKSFLYADHELNLNLKIKLVSRRPPARNFGVNFEKEPCIS